MIDFIKKHWKAFLIGFSVIASLAVGILINRESGRKRNADSGRILDSSTGSQGLAIGLGGLEANQQSASKRLNDLADTNQKLATGQQSASGVIDRAENRIDRLDDILGIK